MEYKNNIPIYVQVIQDIKRKILSGELKGGVKLPSSRELAVIYQINPNTAARVYNEMEQEGITFTKRGIGTFINNDSSLIEKIRHELVDGYFDELTSNLEQMGYNKLDILKLLEEYYGGKI